MSQQSVCALSLVPSLIKRIKRLRSQAKVLTSIISPRLRTAAAALGRLDVKECDAWQKPQRKFWVLYADLGQVYLWCHASLCFARVFWNPAAAEICIKVVFHALVPSPSSNMTAMTATTAPKATASKAE